MFYGESVVYVLIKYTCRQKQTPSKGMMPVVQPDWKGRRARGHAWVVCSLAQGTAAIRPGISQV